MSKDGKRSERQGQACSCAALAGERNKALVLEVELSHGPRGAFGTHGHGTGKRERQAGIGWVHDQKRATTNMDLGGLYIFIVLVSPPHAARVSYMYMYRVVDGEMVDGRLAAVCVWER